MEKQRLEELLAEMVDHLTECTSSMDEALYILETSIGFTKDELIELGFEYLYDIRDEEEEE